jgi:hypothetical protein
MLPLGDGAVRPRYDVVGSGMITPVDTFTGGGSGRRRRSQRMLSWVAPAIAQP